MATRGFETSNNSDLNLEITVVPEVIISNGSQPHTPGIPADTDTGNRQVHPHTNRDGASDSRESVTGASAESVDGNELKLQTGSKQGNKTSHSRSSRSHSNSSDKSGLKPTMKKSDLNAEMQQSATWGQESEEDNHIHIQIDNLQDENRPLLGQRFRGNYGGIEQVPNNNEQPENIGEIDKYELRRRVWEQLDTPRKRWIELRRISGQIIFQTIKTILIFTLVSPYNVAKGFFFSIRNVN